MCRPTSASLGNDSSQVTRAVSPSDSSGMPRSMLEYMPRVSVPSFSLVTGPPARSCMLPLPIFQAETSKRKTRLRLPLRSSLSAISTGSLRKLGNLLLLNATLRIWNWVRSAKIEVRRPFPSFWSLPLMAVVMGTPSVTLTPWPLTVALKTSERQLSEVIWAPVEVPLEPKRHPPTWIVGSPTSTPPKSQFAEAWNSLLIDFSLRTRAMEKSFG